MYFLRYQPLKERLRTRSLGDREALPYLIIFVGLSTLAAYSPRPVSHSLWQAVSIAVGVAEFVIGTYYVYRKNGGAQGYDLLLKYVVLGWVVALRFTLGYIAFTLALDGVATRVGVTPHAESGPLDILLGVAVAALFYQRLGKHIADTRSETVEEAATA